MRKLLRRLALAVFGLLVIGVLTRNFIARKSVEVSVSKLTGFPLEIGAVNVGLFNGQLDVTGLKLMNPPEFVDREFVDVSNVHVDYRLGSMLTGTPHIHDMLVDIQRLVVVRNATGESNAQRLNNGKSSARYRIDQLRIHIGTVTYKDFSRAKFTERSRVLNSTVVYKDIAGTADMVRLVLLTLTSQTHLFDSGIQAEDLKKNMSNVAEEAAQVTTDTGNGVFDRGKQTAPEK